jgi:hypothetical protein
MKACRGEEVYLQSFFTSVLDETAQSKSRPHRFTYGNELQQELNRRLGGAQTGSGV